MPCTLLLILFGKENLIVESETFDHLFPGKIKGLKRAFASSIHRGCLSIGGRKINRIAVHHDQPRLIDCNASASISVSVSTDQDQFVFVDSFEERFPSDDS